MEKLSIEYFYRSIQEEARKKKNDAPLLQRNTLKKKPVSIRTYATRRAVLRSKIKALVLNKVYLKSAIRELPYVGYMLRLLFNLVRLPVKFQQLHDQIENLHQISDQTRGDLNEHELTINQFHENNRNFNKLHQTFSNQIWNLSENLMATQKKSDNSVLKVNELYSYLTRAMDSLKSSLSDDKKPVLEKSDERYLDSFYTAFEDKFRGSSDDIQKKLQAYLPYFKDSSINFSQAPILDVGCGRGEWLQLLKAHGIDCKGVDINRAMIQSCKAENLEVIEQDAISYLSEQKSESLGGITGFHVVEHIRFKTLIRLFDEAYRVLAKGGIILFETPNPENLVVGSCNFYADPTHLNPIPPHTLRFIAEQRGFQRTTFILSSPMREITTFPKDPDLRNIYERMYGPQDYAVLAYKI